MSLAKILIKRYFFTYKSFLVGCLILCALFISCSNNGEALQKEKLTSDIIISHDSGFYDSSFSLSTSTSLPDKRILYTLDGSVPCEKNIGGKSYKIKNGINDAMTTRKIETFVYNSPIEIINRSNIENDISNIPNSYILFSPPDSVLDKATVLRAGIYENGELTKLQTKVFFIGKDLKKYLDIPVLSIAISEDDLWSFSKGIYVPGAYFEEDNIDYSGNHFQKGREWERAVHLDYFDENAELCFSQVCGIRIHGGTSRKLANRSFRIYARSDYGNNTIDYPIFKNRKNEIHKRLKLRTSGQDIIHTYFRDALICNLMINTNVVTEDYQPVNMFLNGEYWGIFNIRERIDEHYFERNYNVKRDKVVILDHWKETNNDYETFRNFLNSFNPQNPFYFSIIDNMIDIYSLLDLKIAEIFFGRWDLHWKVWKESKKSKSKWQWILWDMDVGMGLPNNWGPEWSHNAKVDANYLKAFLTDYHTETANFEFSQIVQNRKIRIMFLNRFAEMLSSNLSQQNILNKIDLFQKQIESSMPKHIERWKGVEGIKSLEQWHSDVDALREFANQRHEHIYQQIIEFYNLPGLSKIEIKGNNNSHLISVNNQDFANLNNNNTDNWQAIYFKTVPIKIKLDIEKCPELFDGWLVNGNHYTIDEELIIFPREDKYVIEPLFLR